MCRCPLPLLPLRVFVLAFLAIANGPVRGEGIVINEFFATGTPVENGAAMASDEFIEFLITAPMTSSELGSLTFGDTHHNTQFITSVFSFDVGTLDGILSSAGLNAFLPGTLIVAKGSGLGEQNLWYNPLSAAVDDHDAWMVELRVGEGFSLVPGAPGQGSMDLSTDKGTVVWIAEGVPANNRDTSGFVDALGVETNPGRVAADVIAKFGNEVIVAASVADGSTAVVRGTDSTGGSASFDVPTMGTPAGGGGGSTEVTDLRFLTVPEPSRAMLLLSTAWIWLLRHRRLTVEGGDS